MKGIVDRIEGQTVVCETDMKKMIQIPLDAFEKRPKEGDVISWGADKAAVMTEETAGRKEKMKTLFERLKKKN